MPAVGDAPVCRKFGPFTVGRKLGAGGMATVYAARRDGARPGDLVALKVLSPAISGDGEEHRAFLREAAIATRLDHPNIVRTFDIGDYDGVMVLAMELVHGVALGTLQKVQKAPAPLDIALRVTSDVARALHAAHELEDAVRGPLGLVHQDVSPHNILIGYDGITKLVDFGVARLAMLEGSRTESLKGKPSYASPEQIHGKHIDRRTDVFALGVVLWELLAGERLFRRETSAATYLAVLHDRIPDVREKTPSIPESIAAVVARALDRDRDARFPTAEYFRLALDASRGERIAEASQEELAFWVAQLVPPKLAFPELERELAQTQLVTTDALVPELGLPATAPVVEKRLPANPIAAAAANEVPDDFDMEIERDGSLASLASMQRTGYGAAPAPTSRLEVTHRRVTAATSPATYDDAPSLVRTIVAYLAAAVLYAATLGTLAKLAHRPGGRALMNALPQAFDGTSVTASGILSGAALVLAIALGFVGLRMRPRSWAVVFAGGAMLFASLAMVTVTLVATEENPGPPDGALLIPYVVPLAMIALAIGIAGRAARFFMAEGLAPKTAGAPVCVIAGALAFLALEASPLASLL